jgi:hypothetical protein
MMKEVIDSVADCTPEWFDYVIVGAGIHQMCTG